MIKSTIRTAPFHTELFGRHRGEFYPVGRLLLRDRASFGYRATMLRDGEEYIMHAGNATGFWYASGPLVPATPVMQVATWLEEQAGLLVKQVGEVEAGHEEEDLLLALAAQLDQVAQTVRTHDWAA